MRSLALLSLSALAAATKHHLFVGTFSGANLYSLEFDDEALSLTLQKNISANAAHSWIALSHDNENLYAVETSAYTSYKVNNGSAPGLTYQTSVAIPDDCGNKGIFIAQQSASPHNVYASTFGNCTTVLDVSASTGALTEIAQNASYASSSGVHGTAFHPSGEFLFSADDEGNAVWTHTVDDSTGLLTFAEKKSGPSQGSNPRHVSVSPVGEYAYVVLESANELAEYKIDQVSGALTFVETWSLIGDDVTSSLYWADEVSISPSGMTLWATARGRETNTTGFISAFKLDSDGAIVSQIFLGNTTGSGGTSNSVATAPFGDEFVALTDSSEEFVQVWRLGNETAEVVAQVDLQDGGCCANAVWLD